MGSNSGQTALIIVGTAVGSYFGYPALGMTLGNLVGQIAFPTDLGTVSGPRLNDLRVMGSEIGAPIPLVYGRYAIAGNLIWSAGIEESVSRQRQGGKGGPTQTVKTFTYSVNCAVGICEGPISGIRRVWADAKLIYDASPRGATESYEDYQARIFNNGVFLAGATFYLGSETQEPDPTIESIEGIGQTSGFRGLAYCVFADFQLEEYGNRIPSFRFEVEAYQTGLEVPIEITGVCGGDFASPVTVSLDLAPLGLQTGDVLLLMVYGNAPAGATAPIEVSGFDNARSILNTTIDNSPFVRLLPFDAAGTTLPIGIDSNIGLAWRRWSEGDATTVTLSKATQVTALNACIHALRNVHPEDPFSLAVLHPGTNTGGNVAGADAMPPNPLPYCESSVRFDFYNSGNGSIVPLSELEYPETDDVLFSGFIQGTEPDGVNFNPSNALFYALRTPVAGEANNLLEYSDFNDAPVSSGWTLTNMSFSLVDSAGIRSRRFRLVTSGAAIKYEMTKSFTCAAGQKYCMWVIIDDQWRATGIGYYRAGTYHGFRTAGLDKRIKEGTDDVRIVKFFIAQDGVSSGTFYYMALYFGFEVETAIELCIPACNSSSPYSRTWANGDATNDRVIHAVGVAEVPSFLHTPALIRNTTGSPLRGGSMTHACAPRLKTQWTVDPVVTTAPGSMPTTAFSLLVRSANAPAPAIDIRHYEEFPHSYDYVSSVQFDQYKLSVGQWSPARRTNPASAGFACPRPIIPGIGHDRLYIEFEVGFIGDPSSSTSVHDPWAYVTIFGDGMETHAADDSGFPRETFTTGARNKWGYSARGRWSEDGTVTAAEDASARIVTGTFVGVGVNLADGEITWYKDGALVRTSPLSVEQRKRWFVAGIGFGEGSRAGHLPQIAVSMTAPRYLPAGFEPIDWPNSPDYVAEVGAGGVISLGQVVASLSRKTGLADEQLDVTQLTETIPGYAVTRVMSARDAIQPLRSYGWFDCVESGTQLRWPVRGQAAVATLTDDDLCAHSVDGERPDAVTTERAQEVDLPRRLRVRYSNPEQNYEPNEQSASRLAAGAEQVLDVELPIAMSADKAAQIADVLLYSTWVERNRHRIVLDHSWLALEPADAITVPVDGQQERLRIVSIDLALPGVLSIDGVRDDDGSYQSYAVGVESVYSNPGGGSLSVPGTAQVVLLDLPLLLDSHNDAGYYAAVRAEGSTTFGGAVIYSSADGGSIYSEVGVATQQAIIGEVDSALPPGPTTIIDYGNELLVTLPTGDELESVSEASLLAGANAAAIGADGRWEVIQFLNAEPVNSPVQWRLTGLLRGRRGTEWAVGTSQAGDSFVRLDAAIVRISMNSGGIGSARLIKAVLVGKTLEDTTAVAFTGRGVALEPFSPVHLTGVRTGDDLAISWIRRGRIGRELPENTDIPLSEETESYEVDILNLAGTAVLRTLTSATQSVTYTAAQQTTDFGSPQSAIPVRAYQLSATVGRGYAAEATL
jgi:hypothetical protein